MKQIITSLGVIVFVAAVVAGGTGAFFSDTETSTGNTFTAGAIDLKVDAQAHYAGLICRDGVWAIENAQVGTTRPDLVGKACDGTWAETDLGITHKFFNVDDVKPGDEGENTISLHVINNDAWMCADVTITSNDDMTCTEPENGAELPSVCGTDGAPTFDGELAQNLEFVAWNDNGVLVSNELTGKGDNIHQAGEALFFNPGPASDVFDGGTLTLADGGTGSPLPGGSTNYIGLAWCAGNMTAATNVAGVSCDGTTMGNDAQTDKMTADITFRVEQSRNNPNFRCVRKEEPTGPIVVNPNNLNGWIIDNFDGGTAASTGDASTGSGSDGTFVGGPTTPPVGTGSFSQVIGTNGNDAQRLMTNMFNGALLSSLTQIEYKTFVSAAASDQATYIQLRIDKDGNGTTDDRIYFEPVYQNGTYSALAYSSAVPNQCGGDPSCVVLNVWQPWNASTGGWWSLTDSAGGPPNTKLADYVTQYPGAKLATDAPAFRMQAGGGAGAWDNFVGSFDELTINGVTYNFEN